jgi:hypothetical protein
MAVGTVTTGAPGSSATIVNVGTPNAAILDFEIPRGDQGAQGDKGDKGDQGDPGPSGVVYATAPLSYDSGTQTVSIDLSAYATQSYVTSQGFITSSALTPYLTSATAASTYQTLAGMSSYLTTSAAASTYLAKSGGYITGDIQSNNGSGYRTWDGATNTAVLTPAYLQFNKSGGGGGALTVEWNGITFASGKQTVHYPGASILNGYATESWVTGQLGSYLQLSGGVMTGSITNVGTTYDSELADWGLGVQQSSDHTKGTTVEFNGLTTYDGASHMLVTPTGLTFPDLTVQTTAYTGGAGTVAWGAITGTLSSQTDLQGELDAKYNASNPAGFVDVSYVNGQGFITQGTADGLYYSNSNPSNFVDAGYVSSALTGYATESFVTTQGYITTPFDSYYRLNFNAAGTNPDPSPIAGHLWFQSEKFRYSTSYSSIGNVIASESWVSGSYAALSGATFTGKVNLATIGVGTPSLNLGGQCDSAPASAANGDLWISNATAPKLTYKMGGVNYNLPVLNQFNTFTNQMVIDTSSATTAALRVTQRGAGNAIEVEDSTTPDATKFVVDQFGKVGVGTAPDATAAIKVDANGISFNGLVFNPTATSAHTGGSDTLDLLVTINGTNYRIGLRPA